ncbi:TcfC E-set like domain-containing protein [Pantoea stewartii]|uniref:TcfC E-set like domain-containing protein n=1 Tax=Pantoea stewartii TaxID=66269 RepID=UPI0021E7E39E|nr:TcfC E-set like domain-containing protein [Pantoea stewartii]UYK96294.1 TcfC E-set like domain-containing protein [Pantoea stewartii]
MQSKVIIFTTSLFCFLNANTFAAGEVPPGFEELANGQIMWLDVSLYGESLGLYKANVDLNNITFQHDDAEQLAKDIRDKYNSDPGLYSMLLSNLTKPLSRNSILACSENGNAQGCDYIDTKKLAIIYNENNANVSLFLDKKFLPEKKVTPFFQETEDSHNALIHQQHINFVAEGNYQSASVQGNGALGVGRNSYVNVDWDWQGQHYRSEGYQKAELNNAYFRQDLWKRVYLQVGIMDSRDIFSNSGGNINLSQLPISQIRGIRVGSTMAWINPSKAISGTPVTVFLTQDSRIDAYKDEQLITSFYLKAGAQELNTKSFPPGSYTVTLRIYENNKLVRTQTTPYTATGSASLNTFQWFLQAGKLVKNTSGKSKDDGRVVQGGARIPLFNNVALTGGATLLSNVSYGEAAIDWMHGFSTGPIDGVLSTRFSTLYGSDGSRGNIQQLNYDDGFSLSFYRSQMSAPDCGSSQSRFGYSGCYKSSSVMLSLPLSSWSWSLGYSKSQNYGRYVTRSRLPVNDPQHSDGLPWDDVWITRSRSRSWQTGLGRSFNIGNLNISTSLNTFIRNDDSYQSMDKGGYVNVSLSRSNYQQKGGSSNASFGATYNSSNINSNLSYNASYSRYSASNQAGVMLSGMNTQNISASTWAETGGQFGEGSLYLNDSYDKVGNEHVLSTSGNYSSSFMLSRKGFSYGRWGNGEPSAAFSVGVDSSDDDTPSAVNVSVDTGDTADVSGNSNALFLVPAYRQTTVNVRESADVRAGAGSEISKGAGTRTLFMTPGKVYTRNTEVNSRYTWLGKMKDEHGHPLENWIPLNVTSWTSFDGGGFTLQTENKIHNVYVMKKDNIMMCPLTVKSVKDVVRFVGETKCKSTSLANLPETDRKQAELMVLRKNATVAEKTAYYDEGR